MMTIQCYRVLSGLKKLSHNSGDAMSKLLNRNCVCCSNDPGDVYDYSKHQKEFQAILHSLVSEGYLIFDSRNPEVFYLTHSAIHFKQTAVLCVIAFLRKHIIDILAFGVSVASLIISIQTKSALPPV